MKVLVRYGVRDAVGYLIVEVMKPSGLWKVKDVELP